MEKIKDLDIRQVGGRGYRFALFLCPFCDDEVEKVRKDGLKAKGCSRKCYTKRRMGVRRGAYTDFIISKGYRYRYAPEHPKARGTRKLYVLESRLVMESVLGRILDDNEIVHHKNENTLDNSPDNLEVMLSGDHVRHHKLNAKRKRNGQFTI